MSHSPNPDTLHQPLYAATSNPGKLRDFQTAAVDYKLAIAPLPGLAEIPAPPETEPTFSGNARLKAVYYSRFAHGQLVIADDSGLEVDALNGEPGVRSARYAADAAFDGDPGMTPSHITIDHMTTDQRNNAYLLRRLAAVPISKRHAQYRCVLALARDGVCLYTAEGSVEGEILTQPRGSGGFGYDPLFYLPTLGKTMAEIDLATKHQISHRGKALSALLQSMEAAALP